MTENQQPEEVEEIELTDQQRFEMGVSAHGDPTGLIARALISSDLLDRLYKSEALEHQNLIRWLEAVGFDTEDAIPLIDELMYEVDVVLAEDELKEAIDLVFNSWYETNVTYLSNLVIKTLLKNRERNTNE